MRSLQAVNNAVSRFSYYQMNGLMYNGQSADRAVTRSAAVLAVFGIGLSSFSLKQMMNKSSKQF